MLALLLRLLLAYFFLPQNQPVEKCTIFGVVVNAVTGEPLNKVRVLALKAGSQHASPAFTNTDAKGEFTLAQLEPGQYRLSGLRNGYLETYYGARRAGSEGIIVRLEPGQGLQDLQLKLLPFAVIAGTVRDPDGEPLAGVSVALLTETYRSGRRRVISAEGTAVTDDLGQYRIVDIAPGKYYVRAALQQRSKAPVDHSRKDAPPSEVPVPTFHPSSRDLAGAHRIEVTTGARFTGADVILLRSRTYRVRVRAEGPAGFGLNVSLRERPDVGDGLAMHLPSNCQSGVCEFAGVPSGSYEVSASASPSDRRGTFNELIFTSHEFRATVPIEVVNADVEGVRVVVNAGADILGRIAIVGEDRAAFKGGEVEFETAAGEDFLAPLSSDGAFTCRLSEERYRVRLHAATDLVVRSIRSEDTDVLQDGLAVTHSGKMPLEIVLARDGGQAEGTVLDKEDKPAAGAIVVLMPEAGLRFRHDLYRQIETDQYGRFQFKTIAPGDYRLFAWDDVEPGIWFDPDFLKDIEARGEAVTVRANGQEHVRLHLAR